MAKPVEIVSPANAARAHRRRLPAIIRAMNARIRAGARLFLAGEGDQLDYPIGLFPLVLKKLQAAKGWEVAFNDRHGTIKIRRRGERHEIHNI